MKLRIASTFSGCGGLDYAFHEMKDDFDVVFVNDFDKTHVTLTKKILILNPYMKTYVN